MINQTNHLSIYLHIPFCSTFCSYCAFNTYTDLSALIPKFVNALKQEIISVGQRNPGYEVGTIYFGGGTPSLITASQYETLFEALHDAFRIASNAEISLEANPNDLSPEYLANLRKLGFNRLSIGMQSAVQAELDLFKRTHNLQSVHNAMEAARTATFTNVSVDLIFGNPKQSLDDWQLTLHEAIKLKPDHISAYNLILKGGTDLTKQVESGILPQPDDDLSADMYDLATSMLRSAGFDQYEITNWSLPGYASEHNLQYWRSLPYLGLGPGAHGYAEGYRTIAKRAPQRYIASFEAEPEDDMPFPVTQATSKATKVDAETDLSDAIMMAMRMTQEGIQRKVFSERFGVDVLAQHRATLERFQGYGLVYFDDDVIRLTESGRLVSNAIIRELI